jgi:hypothetical protein
MSERSERIRQHGLSDGGACGAGSGHWCAATGTRLDLTHDEVVHQ